MHVVFVMANNSSVPYFNWFAEAASQQTEVKFTFVCLYPEPPRMIEDMKEFGCDCHWVKFDCNHRKRDMVMAVPPLIRLFRRLKPDVVHSHLFDDAVPTLLAARIAGVKKRVITKADGGYHYYHTPQWVMFDKFNNFNATHIVAISEENKQVVTEIEKPKAEKVSLIHHGIPIKQFIEDDEHQKKRIIEKYKLHNKIVFGTVARLIEWKGYRYIIEAAEKVVKKYPEAVFLLVGVGLQEDELKELVRKAKLESHIIFTGWVDRELIPSLYKTMNIYIHPATIEPFGFVIAEAMMSGVPIISTPTGAAKDIIEHKENGYLVPYKDSKALAEGILYLLERDLTLMGKKAQEAAKNMYDFKLMWKNHLKLFQN